MVSKKEWKKRVKSKSAAADYYEQQLHEALNRETEWNAHHRELHTQLRAARADISRYRTLCDRYGSLLHLLADAGKLSPELLETFEEVTTAQWKKAADPESLLQKLCKQVQSIADNHRVGQVEITFDNGVPQDVNDEAMSAEAEGRFSFYPVAEDVTSVGDSGRWVVPTGRSAG